MPPAFFPVGLNVDGRRCVVIGPASDAEARSKVAALRECGADVAWITDPDGLREGDVRDAFLVISTPLDAALSQRLRDLADHHRFLLCTIDQPQYGSVAMTAVVKAGPARIAISTGGVAPRVGKQLREGLEGALDATFARFLDCLATQKRRNRRQFSDDARARRAAMIDAAKGFGLDIDVRYPEWFEAREAVLHPRVEAR